jgi:hypothetical protein
MADKEKESGKIIVFFHMITTRGKESNHSDY